MKVYCVNMFLYLSALLSVAFLHTRQFCVQHGLSLIYALTLPVHGVISVFKLRAEQIPLYTTTGFRQCGSLNVWPSNSSKCGLLRRNNPSLILQEQKKQHVTP